jgi:hypothetical protein
MEQLTPNFVLKEQCGTLTGEPSSQTVLHADQESFVRQLACMNLLANVILGTTVPKKLQLKYPLQRTIAAHLDIIVLLGLQILKDAIQAYINLTKAMTLVSPVLLQSFVLVIQVSLKSVLRIVTALVAPSNQSFVRMVHTRTRTQQDCIAPHSARRVLLDIFVSGVIYLGNAELGIFAIKAIQLQHQTAPIRQLEKGVPTAFTVLLEL